MNFGLHELAMSGLALFTLPIFFFAPGYAIASATGLFAFGRQSWLERSLWAAALSQPVALLLAVHSGLPLSPSLTTACFLVVSALACGLAVRDWRQDARSPLRWDNHCRLCALAAVALVLYCVLAAVPVEVHGRLYESAIWQDWSVRIALVNSAIRGGNFPGNPMFAPGGHPAPLHYYFFWYVLCARMHDIVPVSARAILTASCAGASLSLLAFLFLCLKHLGLQTAPLRRQCTALILAGSLIGLDLLPSAVALLRHRVFADLQFWLSDRSPSLLHMILWSPHHVGGLVSCGLGTLLLVRTLDVSRSQRAVHVVLAAVCFAASAGTSTFITLLFASACAALIVDAALRRQWPVVVSIAAAGALSAVLDAHFLRHVLLASSGAPASLGEPHARLLILWPRYAHEALEVIWLGVRAFYRLVLHRIILVPVPGEFVWTQRLLRPPVALLLFFLDFGFFALVLIRQARHDLFRPQPMPRNARLLWLIFAGIAIPGCLLNSASLQNNNDLGRHAGLCMRFVLLLWSAPLIADFLARWRRARSSRAPLQLSSWQRVAVFCAVLGLLGQVTQVLMDRIRVPLTDAGLLPRVVVAERVPRIGARFAQMQKGMAAAAGITPRDGIVQSNPHSRFQPVLLLYTDRQMAASDDGCNTPFGGDPRACAPVAEGLIELFGGSGRHFQGESQRFESIVPFDPTLVTPENFARICATDKLDAMVANYADPVWHDPASWVWQLTPIFANGTVRVFACPTASQLRRLP